MIRQTPYWIGDIVYLRVADEKRRGMVTGVMFRQGETYAVTWPDGNEKWHAAIELTSEYIPEWSDETSNRTESKE